MARKKKQPIFTLEQKQAADAQIKESQKQIDYDTKDFTIELLISKFNKGDFFIPPYQRRFVWKEKNKNLFLESIFLGLPIPFMFLADCSDGRQEIDWLNSDKFKEYTTSDASNNEGKLKLRVEYVRDQLLKGE